ncbi:hypothetical protein PVL29_013909 [Vitis rotundifolia]|uniref:Strictosidine synthase conserved region domain-containing protein n=1 Tax=Vitis rotundifolia TaxID=103349 RepID=A0AA38ZGC2_VITRO|nr:hypothetical protein PVL29_013909 [Vitis rotundifolia]
MAGNNGFRPSKQHLQTCSSFVLASILASTLRIYFFSPISPDPLHLPPVSAALNLPTNKKLQEVTKIGEGFLNKPEDLCFDEEGILYTATGDGWIKRLHRNGSWEDWKLIGGYALLGITTARAGGIFVCDAQKGLLKVGEGGVSLLTSHVNGSEISLYFSVASSKFGLHHWYLDLLEAKPHGQLLKYDPLLNETSILLDNLAFANGVALSQDEDFLVMASDGFEFVHASKALKHFLATFPKLFQLVKGSNEKATVVKVAADGKIVDKFDDPNGKVMSFVTSALEFEDHLYLGSLNTNFIGKLPLKAA